MPQKKRERICRFCKKLLNPPEGKRVPVVSVFNRVKNKELNGASGQESVVLAAEVEKLGHCLQRGMNFPELSCLSCARQVVRVLYSCTVITSRCNEPLEQLADSPDQCTTPTSSSRRPTAVRSPTGETPSAKRNKEGNTIDEESATGKSSRRSLSFQQGSIEAFPKETENPLTLEEKIQARMHEPREEKPVVKVTFGLNLFEIAKSYYNNKHVSIRIRSSLDIPNQGRSRNMSARMHWKKVEKAVKNIALKNPGAAAADTTAIEK